MLGHVHPIETCVEELRIRLGEANRRADMWDGECGTLVREQAEIKNEILKYRGILLWCAQQVFNGCDVDGGGFQDRMVELGLLVEVPHELKPDWFLNEWGDDKTNKMYTLKWEKLGQQVLEAQDPITVNPMVTD